MKKSLSHFAGLFLAVGGLLYPATALAVTETANYTETFDGITDASAADFAPEYWLHNVDRGSASLTDVWYTAQSSGGHDGGAYISVSDQCNRYLYYDCLVTPPVKGEVSFWVKGNRVNVFKMTFDGVKITKGSEIALPADFAISDTEWQKVTLDVADYTRLGIVFRSGANALDDFAAAYADLDPIVFTTLSDITCDEAPVADVNGDATINVSITFNNKGTADVDLTDVTFTFGKTNYYGDNLTSEIVTLPSNEGVVAPGESKKLTFAVPYKLSDPSVTESNFYFGVRNSLNGATAKVGSVKVLSIVGIFELYNGTTKVTAGGYVEGDYHTDAYTLTLGGSNTGQSDITITDIEMDGTLDGAVTTVALPITLAKGANKEDIAFTFDATLGAKTGNVTLTYSDGISTDRTFTFALGGATVAQDGWIEDFQTQNGSDEYAMPKGWRVENGSFRRNSYASYDSRYRANSASSGESTLVTSLMKIEKGGQLSLMGGRQSVSDSHDKVLVIYLSKDRETWTELGGVVAKLGTGRTPFNTFEAPATANDMRWYSFSFKNVETGNYYIKFVAHPFSLDNIFGVTPVDPDHDFILESISAPASGEVNKLLTAKVEISNMLGSSDGDYVVTLFEGETAVAQAEGVAIDAYGKTTVELSYMPRTAGEAALHAEVEVGDGEKTLKSSEVTVNVAEEECVGKAEQSIDKYETLFVQYKFQKIQFYVPADQISFPVNKEIKELEFSVYNSSTYQNLEMPYTLWIEEVDEVTPFSDTEKENFVLPDESTATIGSYTLAFGESAADAPAKCIIPLATPMVYNGKALKITIDITASASHWSFYIGHHNYDTNMLRKFEMSYEGGTYPGANLSKSAPAVHLRYALEPSTVSGRIVKNKAAQAGLKVVLTERPESGPAKAKAQVSADAAKVAYTGVTDSDGRFTIPVVKNERAYQLSVESADGNYVHPTLVHPNTPLELNDVDITPVPTGIDAVEDSGVMITVSGSSVKVDGADAVVFNTNGTQVGEARDGEALDLSAGIYIVRINGTSEAHKILIR
ncbi:MAG: hypothetical protein K2I64_02535 [Muribaculaceae bacterium]|nr:hypothetical protein [Muribaculaceae bacterium]